MILAVKPGTNIENAVISASKEYCLTDEEKDVFEYNCNCFNWGDFDTYVPNSICEKYGIKEGSIGCEYFAFGDKTKAPNA